MKKYLLFIVSCFYLSSYAQYKDQYVADLISKRELFKLVEQESITDSVYYATIKYLAKGLIGFYSNNPNQSNNYFEKLLTDHQHELDPQSIYNYKLIMCTNYMRLKQYDLAYSLLSQIDKTKDSMYLLKLCSVKKEYPDFTEWNSVPISLRKDSIGLSMVPIKDLNDSIHYFIFDTGAPFSMIPENECSKFGIKIVEDSVIIDGKLGKIGVAQSFKIGEVVTKNMLFTVIPDSISKFPKINVVLKVIGWDFMQYADNIQITKDSINFNQKLNNQKLNNLLMDGPTLLVNIRIGDSTVPFFLDTGSQSSFINSSEESKLSPFGSQNKLDSIGVGGFANIRVEKIKLFKNVSISSGTTIKIIPGLMMRYPSENNMQYYFNESILGQDILQLFSKAIIDIKNNTFILE